MLLFLFGDFLLNLDTFPLLLLIFFYYFSFLSRFLLSLHSLFHKLFGLLESFLSVLLFFNDLPYFSLMLLFGQNVRNRLLGLFIS